MTFPLPEAQRAFDDAAARLDALLATLTDERQLASSRCHGWLVCDVIAHLHLGLAEMITGFAYPTDAPADTDYVSYWRAPGDPDPAHTRFVRLLSSAYQRPDGLITHVRRTLDAARRFAALAGDGSVAFQRRTLPTGDFLVTWAVEIAVHHLDMVPGREAPDLTLVVRTLDGLGLPRDGRTDLDYVLAGTGRAPGSEGRGLLG